MKTIISRNINKKINKKSFYSVFLHHNGIFEITSKLSENLRLCYLFNFFQHNGRFESKKYTTKAEIYQVLPCWSGNLGLGCMGVFVRVARSCMGKYKCILYGCGGCKGQGVCCKPPYGFSLVALKQLQKVTKGI